MKRINKLIIVMMIFCSTMFLSIAVNPVLATSDVNYTFKDNILYNSTNPIPNLISNIRNQTEYTEIYNATYSFTNDINEQDPAGWVVTESGNGLINVISDLDGHEKVLKFADTSTASINVYNTFTDGTQVFGTFEFWIRTTDVGKRNYVILKGEGVYKFYIMSYNDLWYYNDGVEKSTGITSLNNTWYHIRIDFECGAGSYLELNPDTWNIWINGKLIISGATFQNVGLNADSLHIVSASADANFDYFYDAIGYSWDSDYTVNDNIVPFNFQNNILEIDKYEFFNNEDGSFTTNGQETIPYWTELNSIGYITKNDNQALDETSVYFPIATATQEGIEKTIDITFANIRNIFFRIHKGGNEASETLYEYFDIDSFDDTLICRLRIDDVSSSADLRLSYYNGVSYIEIENISNGWYIYTFNITIIDNLVKLTVIEYDDITLELISENDYYFPLITTNKEGIGDIKINAFLSGTSIAQTGLFIDSIGIYVNNYSVSNDFGSYFYSTGGDFHQDIQNLLFLNASGIFSCGITSFEVGATTFEFFDYQNVSTITTINSYGKGGNTLTNAYLVVSSNNTFNLNLVLIKGIFLNDGTTNYSPIYYNDNINITESYFYVDNNSYLSWSLEMNDNDTEYIQANFNVIDFSDDDYSMYCYGYEYSNGYGYFGVNYADSTSVSFPMPNTLSPVNYYLNTQIDITEIVILITDNDDYYTGVNTGIIQYINFNYIAGADLTLATLSLTNVIIDLIVILIPSLLIYYAFDKKRDVLLISMILMLVVSFASLLIPLWLFSIGLASLSMFFFIKTEEESF